MKRTDRHRPGAIVPADYSLVTCYSLASSQDGIPMPSVGVNCELDNRIELRDPKTGKITSQNGKHAEDGRCCVIGLLHVARVRFAATGGTGKCSVCGASFVHGDVWVHDSTGEHIHVGHTCAAKYELLADRSAWELARDRAYNATARSLVARQNAEERELFLSECPGLREAFSVVLDLHGPVPADKVRTYGILVDLHRRFFACRGLSEKQVALAIKLSAEYLAGTSEKVEEKKVQAPEGRQVVRGTVVSKKLVEGLYGETVKMTVKVETPEGVWLAWGTRPTSIAGLERGDVVEFTATLKRGRDDFFALFSRPTKASIVERATPAGAVA